MSTLALNSNNDVYFTLAGRLATIENKNSDAEILQRIKVRLRFFKDEWFLNSEHGVPYFRDIVETEASDIYILGSKSLDLNILESIFREQILDVEGVKGLIESSVDYVGTQRKITYFFQVVSINNTKINDNLIVL